MQLRLPWKRLGPMDWGQWSGHVVKVAGRLTVGCKMCWGMHLTGCGCGPRGLNLHTGADAAFACEWHGVCALYVPCMRHHVAERVQRTCGVAPGATQHVRAAARELQDMQGAAYAVSWCKPQVT